MTAYMATVDVNGLILLLFSGSVLCFIQLSCCSNRRKKRLGRRNRKKRDNSGAVSVPTMCSRTRTKIQRLSRKTRIRDSRITILPIRSDPCRHRRRRLLRSLSRSRNARTTRTRRRRRSRYRPRRNWRRSACLGTGWSAGASCRI